MENKKKYMPKGLTQPSTTLTRKQIIGFMARMDGGDKAPITPQMPDQMQQPGPQMPMGSPSPQGGQSPQGGETDIHKKLMSIFGRSPV